jgi:TRAP-type mannitol/chloroaromatic compound transport system permease small subunit
MKRFLQLSRAIDGFNTLLGKLVAWGILAAVVVSAVNAIIRKAFNMSSNAWLEIQWNLFGAVFLLCAAWTLISNEHVRIDIINNALPKWAQQAIELLGHLFFLMPVTFVILYTGWPFFWRSWLVNEQSSNAGGLPVYPSKFLIPLAFTLLFVQAFSELIKRVAIMTGRLEDTPSGGGHHAAAAEAERILQAAREDAAARPETSRSALS